MNYLKKIINKFLKKYLGLEIKRVNQARVVENRKIDLALYENLFPSESLNNRAFYNIGAGAFSHPLWTNIDLLNEWYCEIQSRKNLINYDLFSLEKMPINSETAEIVYSSHTIEHITDDAAQNMFNEAFRILKKGGLFRISVPDIDLYFRAYQNDDRDFFYWIEQFSQPDYYKRAGVSMPMKNASTGQIFLAEFATQISALTAPSQNGLISDDELAELFKELDYEKALNYCTAKCSIDFQRQHFGNHMNWWNQAKAVRMLNQAGFRKVYKSGYGQSASPILRDISLFDNTHPKISLYMEAVKI